MCHLLRVTILSCFIYQFASCAILERLFNEAASCGIGCEKYFSDASNEYELRKSCAEGCRLYTVIGLAKDLHDTNKTIGLCKLACSEAFINESAANACNQGCSSYPIAHQSDELQDTMQTLHVLHPLVYVRSAFNQVRSFVSASWTVYVQEDNGQVVVMQNGPRVVQTFEYSLPSESVESQQVSGRVDWMDCLSSQSGIPRWILLVVLFTFVLALLWLCCATAHTAPKHYMHTNKKKEMGYVLICEPASDLKSPLINIEEAPPLPSKVSLI